MNPLREIRTNPRQFFPSVLVVFIAALFGTAIMQGIAILTAWLSSEKIIAESETAQNFLSMIGVTFFLIALFVSAIVIANTFSIIIAGRSRQLALLRLIGASSKRLRRAASAEGLIISVPAAVLAFAASTGLAKAAQNYLGSAITEEVALLTPTMAVPALATIIVTWASAYLGARRITGISPIEATSQAVEVRPEDARASLGGLTASLILLSMGLTFLVNAVIGAADHRISLISVVLTALGSSLTFLGVIIGHPWILPPLQAAIGWLCGRTAVSRLAASTIARHPTRNARTVIGLVIGITLIVMFATAMTTFRDQLLRYARSLGEEGWGGLEDALATVIDKSMLFALTLILFSVIIAIIGVANTLMLSVRQRTQEIGLLMALGQTPKRVRRMITAEGLQLSLTACAVAVPLGIVFGWVGALTLLSPLLGLFAPSVPWAVVIAVIAVIVCTLIAVFVASREPARAATSISPVEALEAV
ncbi:ABC transporter permease [Brevibacterium linens]|uniref:Putative ABC transport system permease protein n=1 Tax=Brevibacterium linens ATCC 9172 TaxID=1255617 RepID=A0A2H1IIG5_BRELN|nr:FtsX-like permease family protein [Brevibacterium linens]KAB1948448.1 FtsX-like permease family protein [Brevibacterium linens ATCC 9172]SMX74920.1 putative ABC transport system permease protein [Brevibacterium linens ATCC 9172]